MKRHLTVGQKVVADGTDWIVVGKKMWPFTKYLLLKDTPSSRLTLPNIYKEVWRHQVWLMANPKPGEAPEDK